jgi:hypothetical protein
MKNKNKKSGILPPNFNVHGLPVAKLLGTLRDCFHLRSAGDMGAL